MSINYFSSFFKGDALDFVHSKSLQIYGGGKVSEVNKLSERELEITLEKDIPKGFRIGDVVENVTWTPSVIIKDNYFSGANTRGVLMTTSKSVLIENNTFFRLGMHGILIANDASSWYESGPVKDVVIRGNRFVDCGYNKSPNSYIINIWPENHESVKGYYVHENIVIENNIFETFDTPILRARSTNNLFFRNNKIVQTDTFINKRKGKPSFFIQQCKNVNINLQESDKEAFDQIKWVDMKKSEWKLNYSASK